MGRDESLEQLARDLDVPPELVHHDSANHWSALSDHLGECAYCGEHRSLRVEPFGGQLACKRCWEQICYGED